MKYKALIVDDEQDARELMRIQLSIDKDLQIVGEAVDGKEALEKIDLLKPDIVLLDIQMPELNGLEVVSQSNADSYFIFITAYDEFAVNAFELNAVDYLLKPFSEKRLAQAIQKAKAATEQSNWSFQKVQSVIQEISDRKDQNSQYVKRLVNKTKTILEFISVDDIHMIEAADQYVKVFTAQNQFLLRHSMDYLEQVLDPGRFIRTHRSYIVSIESIKAIEQYEPRNFLVLLQHELKAKLSHNRKELLQFKMGLI